ncbi:MAG: SH3 domain-containing protein, partial [Clostridiales bacterium]|nr:SH3 domain-containing protein [Clostridiales bacterium]
MKKVLSLLFVLILLASLLPVTASINVPSSTMYVKTANGKTLNLREQPDENAKVIAKIPYAAEVQVYSDFLGMVWYHVQYGMYNGYVKTEFLSETKPRPHVTPTPRPTVKPTPTRTPSPEEEAANEIAAAKALGLVPQGLTAEGNVTWQELDQLLTNAIRLKNKNSAAGRSHVYLSLAEYQAASAGFDFNIVLRGVAAAEMYGALIDMGES